MRSSSQSSYFNFLSSFFGSHSQPSLMEDVAKKPRKRTAFEANKTASLALPDEIVKVKIVTNDTPTTTSSMPYSIFNSFMSMIMTATTPEIKKERIVVAEDIHKKMVEYNQEYSPENVFKQVDLLKSNIEEHSARRVDLFLLILLAVYKKNAIVSKGDTVKQHGKGSKKYGTQACHSSLFPNLIFECPSASIFSFWSQPSPLVIIGTQLEEALNMTVELPNIVNAFDGHIEGRSSPTKYTKACLDIINRVSRGEIDPRQGLNEFLQVMATFFNHFENKYIKSKKNKVDPAIQLVWEYEKRGTFQVTNDNSLTVSDDYFYAAIGLKEPEISKVKWSPRYYLPSFYQRVQNEILTSKPIEGKRPKNK